MALGLGTAADTVAFAALPQWALQGTDLEDADNGRLDGGCIAVYGVFLLCSWTAFCTMLSNKILKTARDSLGILHGKN